MYGMPPRESITAAHRQGPVVRDSVYWFCRSEPDRLSALADVCAFLPKQEALVARSMNRHEHTDSEQG